jgi:hypothetical protein
MTVTRKHLKSRIVARLSANPLGHPVLAAIAREEQSDLRVKLLALAVTRVELECRQKFRRMLEYAYVAVGAPHCHRVTIGPSQLRWSTLVAAHEYCCHCGIRRRAALVFHVLRTDVYVRCVLHHVSELWKSLGDAREVVNGYTKGIGAGDLKVPTMYSEVALELSRLYRTLNRNGSELGLTGPRGRGAKTALERSRSGERSNAE